MGNHRRPPARDEAVGGPKVPSQALASAGRNPRGSPHLRRICAAALALWSAALAAEVASSALMPQRGDHALLSWREGPPYFTTARYASERRLLRLETGYYSAEFDTEGITVAGFSPAAAPRDETSAARAALAAEPLPAARLQLSVSVGGIVYRGAGRRPLALDAHGLPATPLEFPVRLIEGGRYFQKFSLHDLEFKDDSGQRLPASARLEVSAWPDRLGLAVVVRPEKTLASARAFARLQSTGGRDASVVENPATWTAGADHRVVLTVDATGAARPPAAPDGVTIEVARTSAAQRGTVRWNPEEGCHEVILESAPWPEVTEGIYPAAMLDAWETHDLTIENRSPQPQCVALGFDYRPVKAITGFVPMLLDDRGRPSGIPVQVSKNWHQVAEGTELPHAGPWMHGRALIHLPADSRTTLRHGLAFARWGGVPTASLAQLSLVGWGHNGFWDEFALGSFGESLCFQPGRTMRRALLTDFRPLLQRGFTQGDRQAWASNLGGADTLVRLDPRGRYVGSKRNVTRYASHGPNLAQLDYEEVSADDAIHSRVSLFVPRTDDTLRAYLRIRYDVRRTVEFSRLALFQLGADYYNDSNAPAVAWGHADGLWAEHRPKFEAGGRPGPAWIASGRDPWISLHGENRADSERSGQGARGLVVRAWQARLGGRVVAAPTFTAVASRGPKPHLGAEIVPPAELTTLQRGDSVDMLVELFALPLHADRYYGPDRALAAALSADANTWKMAHREAALNRPVLEIAGGSWSHDWPLTLSAADAERGAFALKGGLGWIPLRITGLDRPDAIELSRLDRDGLQRVEQGPPDRPFWQTDFDAATGQWSVTYNLPATDVPVRYQAVAPAPAVLRRIPAAEPTIGAER